MAKTTAKITQVDGTFVDPLNLSKDTPLDSPFWKGTSEVSLVVEVESEGVVYPRKLTFRIHSEKVFNFGGPVTIEDVESAILAEVHQVESLRKLKAVFEEQIGLEQVEKIQSKVREQL